MKNYQDKGSRSGGFRGGNGDRKEGFRGKSSFQKKSFGNDRKSDLRGDREQTLYKATCSECSKSCDVPFRPTNDKPVYCRDCFAAKRDRETAIYEAGKFGKSKVQAHSYSNKDDSSRSEVKVSHVPSDDGMKKHLMDISSKLDSLILAIEKMSASNQIVSHDVPVETPEGARPVFVQTKTTKNILKAITKTTTKKADGGAAKEKKVATKAVAKTAAKKVAAKSPVKTVTKSVTVKKAATKKAK